jgi:hypothetical protein
MTILEIACEYIAKGWHVVPIPYREKGPVLKGWQALHITADTAARYFNSRPQNIGVVLCDGLVDVDLDSAEAIAAASRFLERPTCSFGRKSKRNSHYLYCCPGLADSVSQAAIQFVDPVTKAMLCELRCGGDAGHAAQTVFPGSTHQSGELISWEDNVRDVLTLPPATLLKSTRRIAVAALLARHMPASGARHNAFLTIGGWLSRGGFAEPHAALVVDAIIAAGDFDRDHA